MGVQITEFIVLLKNGGTEMPINIISNYSNDLSH